MTEPNPHSSRTANVSAPRGDRTKSLTSNELDILIVGGGIHGASLAKLAARSGLRTGLLEMGDYASATSSRSSKMAHGGLRYLEMFDFQQVFEGIKSREELFEQCPNLVAPENFLIPIKARDYFFRVKLGIGLCLYDLMVSNRARKHRWISRSKLSFASFHSGRSDLMGCFRYTDGLMNDSRLVVEMIMSAEQHGAVCLNHARVERIEQRAPGSMDVSWVDLLTGSVQRSRCKIVVNCTGPWAPFVREASDTAEQTDVRYSRGSHLVFSVPWKDPSLFLPMEEKGRYYFVWPHPTGTMVGTTEREVTKLDLNPQPSADEVQEILDRLAKDLPGSGLDRSTLHYAFAGVRTLPMRSTRKGVSQLSRKHIWQSSKGVLTLLGGKYTTFAWTAAEGLKLVQKTLGKDTNVLPGALDDLPSSLGPVDLTNLLAKLERDHGRKGPAVARAVQRLGRLVLRYVDRQDAWTEITPGVLRLELLNALELEHAETLDDVLRRRLDLEFTPSHGLETVEAIKELLSARYSAETLEEQRKSLLERLESLHSILGLESLRDSKPLNRNFG